MLPPPPLQVLEANPNLRNLYEHLTEQILTKDGSSRAKQEEYEALAGRLNQVRVASVRCQILLKALDELTHEDSDIQHQSKIPRQGKHPSYIAKQESPAQQALTLPPDLRELVYNVVSYLSVSLDSSNSDPLPSDTDELMANELAQFQRQLPEISRLLCSHLINTEASLTQAARSLHPDSAPQIHRRSLTNDSLADCISSLQISTTSSQRNELQSALSSTSASLSKLLSHHIQNLNSTIRNLELNTHGSQARHTAARATYLSTVPRGISLKAQILALEREKALYSNRELMDILENEHEKLQIEDVKLGRRERELEGLLAEYEREGREAAARTGASTAEGTGEDVFRVLGARYAEVEREIEEVKRDIEQLETRVWRGR